MAVAMAGLVTGEEDGHEISASHFGVRSSGRHRLAFRTYIT
jgi:hypothetical protein